MNTTTITNTTTVAVDATALKAALAKIKAAIARSHAPALRCIRVDATSNEVRLTATDLDDTLSTTIAGIVTEPGSLLVPYALLNKLLTAHNKGTVEITNTTVKLKNLSLTFEPVDVAEFPKIDPGEGRTIELNLDALRDIMGAISKDDTRPILCSVLVRGGTYVATDSYRLHIVETTTDTGPDFLLYRTGALIAAKYDGTVTATVHDRHLTIQLDETTTLVARLVQGEFPNYRNLIPVNSPRWVTLSDSFLADVKPLLKVTAGDPTAPMRFTQGDGELNVAIHGDWKATATTPGSTEVDIAFNPQYLLDLLAGTTSNVLGVVDSLKPAVLREPAPELGEDAQRVRLIMPARH